MNSKHAPAPPPDFDLQSYHFELPQENIAQTPAAARSSSRLLVLDRASGAITHSSFSRLDSFLPKECLIVANNTRVLPARLEGKKSSGGKVEFLLLTPLPLLKTKTHGNGQRSCTALGLLRASRAPSVGDRIDLEGEISLAVLEKHQFGQYLVRLEWSGELEKIFFSRGHMPLPPYIRRPDGPEDRQRYQTAFCSRQKTGSVAAPTAGLHFTPEIRQRLLTSGRKWAEITLYVGYGTFSPIRCRDIRRHQMHSEYAEIPARTAKMINRAKARGESVLCVGTTTVRALEGAFQQTGDIRPYTGWTDIFITPESQFFVTDHMLTNFHLPQSSLIVMVSALAGRERILAAYKEAVQKNYRFFSYGDSMLIL